MHHYAGVPQYPSYLHIPHVKKSYNILRFFLALISILSCSESVERHLCTPNIPFPKDPSSSCIRLSYTTLHPVFFILHPLHGAVPRSHESSLSVKKRILSLVCVTPPASPPCFPTSVLGLLAYPLAVPPRASQGRVSEAWHGLCCLLSSLPPHDVTATWLHRFRLT